MHSAQEYQQLKDSMLSLTRKAGGGLAAYLLYTVDGSAALCALIGSAASNLYLLWLFRRVTVQWLAGAAGLQPCVYWLNRDVDQVTGNDRVAYWDADKVGTILRT